MPSLAEIARAVYSGYVGDGERHRVRIAAMFLFAATIALSPSSLNKDALSMMGVMVSVLAGFSFTALFSSQSHSLRDLPAPKDESDRLDLNKLKILFSNFRDRSKYFLIMSIICLLMCLVLLVKVNFTFFLIDQEVLILSVVSNVWKFACGVGRAFCILVFLEIIYTFYRMSQTIFAIIETRRLYLEQDRP